MESTRHQIFFADARDMREVADESVDLIVTSPPYWQLKDYGAAGQIGFDDSYEDYINNLNLVWLECGRVLRPGRRLCVNIGDQFARAAYYGRYKVIPIRAEVIRFCETIGFDYMGAVIWQKVTTVNTSGGACIMGSFPYPPNGIVKLDYEFILLFKKLGQSPPPAREIKERSKLTKEEWNTYFYGHWTFPGVRQRGHLAMFPEELPKRLIKMFSFVGETVLDPFLGSGTTCLAARNAGRCSIGYEVNPDFQPLIEKRLGLKDKGLFDGDAECEMFRPEREIVDWTERRECLPYVFRDPVKFTRRADPRKRTYGSRIDARPADKPARARVVRVDAPDAVTLDDGRRVRLAGIKPRPDTAAAAMEFLQNLAGKGKVFVKPAGPANEGAAGYLYLSNRTHVNLHLARSGLVDVDREGDYEGKERFLRAVERGAR